MRLLLVCAVTLLALAAPAHAEDFDRIQLAGIMKVGICLNVEPFGYRDSEDQPKGFDVDLARTMAMQFGVALQIVDTVKATRVEDLLQKRFDILICNMTATAERARRIDFSFPYVRTGIKMLVRRGAGIAGIGDVGPQTRLVVVRGTMSDTLAQQRAPASSRTYVGSPGDATLRLLSGEADAMLDDGLTVDHIARAHPAELVALPEVYSDDALAIAIRKDNPDLLRWLDLFVSTYVSSGKYAELYGKWFDGAPPPLPAVW